MIAAGQIVVYDCMVLGVKCGFGVVNNFKCLVQSLLPNLELAAVLLLSNFLNCLLVVACE